MPVVTPNALERRRLLRAGVVAAGVAAGAVAASAGVATKAEAATGDTLILGTPNEADQTTAITKSSLVNTGATLGLSNPDGPTLFLDPVSDDWEGDLQPGEIINTNVGLFIGLLDEDTGDVTTDYLVTGSDLGSDQFLVAVDPERLLDTRSDRSLVVGASSETPFDDSGRLKAFHWIDVAVISAEVGLYVDSAFFNLTATQALSGGNMTAYPPGDRPNTSTLNFQKGVSLANGTFVSLDVVNDTFAVRIFTTATVHVILDFTGANISFGEDPEDPEDPEETGAKKLAATRRRRPSRRQLKSMLRRKPR